MAFPLTHLCVAWRILETHSINEKDASQFMLGTIAPDAVHYREEFQGAAMSNIGPAKKITHLCPVSEERWGQVTDNDGWVECVKNFLRVHPNDPFAAGYAAHVLTDIHNNLTIWNDFRTSYPVEAAKGYTSGYYKDLHNIDTRLYQEFPAIDNIFTLLEKATPAEIPGLISSNETRAIQQNLLHENYKNTKNSSASKNYRFATWDNTMKFIQTAAEFCINIILPTLANS
ncbi:MAG: hypothetical protein FWE27_07135 [Defluviitaleaceae bacterium]|nr:hypothetical protein [Defluviitaleaceae bacterium]